MKYGTESQVSWDGISWNPSMTKLNYFNHVFINSCPLTASLSINPSHWLTNMSVLGEMKHTSFEESKWRNNLLTVAVNIQCFIMKIKQTLDALFEGVITPIAVNYELVEGEVGRDASNCLQLLYIVVLFAWHHFINRNTWNGRWFVLTTTFVSTGLQFMTIRSTKHPVQLICENGA